jgi:hypothetical protein
MSTKDQKVRTMLFYLQAFWQLFRFEYYLMRGSFAVLYSEVRNYPILPQRHHPKLCSVSAL